MRWKGTIILAIGAGLLATGCANKSYVRKEVDRETAAVHTRVDNLQGQVEATQTKVREHDEQIAAVSRTAQEALRRAQEAGKLAEGTVVFETVLSDDKVHFGFDKNNLSDEAKAALDGFAVPITSQNENVYVEIQGHTDSVGSDSYNEELGLERAEAVRRYLNMQHHIPLHRMSVISYGESAPVTDNKTRESRATNRRIVLAVLASTHLVLAAPEFRRVRILFATDRAREANPSTDLFYSGRRKSDGVVEFGFCEVSIPHDHRLGQMESPSMWRLDSSPDPSAHIAVLRVVPISSAEFAASIRSAQERKGEILVFIHGFNVTFNDGARRTAQLAYDLGFRGTPILYSWPSRGSASDYPADEATVDASWRHLKLFLETLTSSAPRARTVLIAHSMGSRLLARALDAMAREKTASVLPRFAEVVLAAPDVDADELRQLTATLRSVGGRITLYGSSNDWALKASHRFHRANRAGESGDRLFLVPEFETLDASAVDTDLLNHSYYGDSGTMISDLYWLIRQPTPPPRLPGTREAQRQGRRYWVLAPIRD